MTWTDGHLGSEIIHSCFLNYSRIGLLWVLSAENFSLEKSEVWSTDGKNFDRWICQLVYCMIALCEDVPIR